MAVPGFVTWAVVIEPVSSCLLGEHFANEITSPVLLLFLLLLLVEGLVWNGVFMSR